MSEPERPPSFAELKATGGAFALKWSAAWTIARCLNKDPVQALIDQGLIDDFDRSPRVPLAARTGRPDLDPARLAAIRADMEARERASYARFRAAPPPDEPGPAGGVNPSETTQPEPEPRTVPT